MAANDNWHIHPGPDCCGGGEARALITPTFFPEPSAPPAASPRCPATMRHTRRYRAEAVGVQCKYTPGHEGDHCGYAGIGEGDVFWPQEVTVP